MFRIQKFFLGAQIFLTTINGFSPVALGEPVQIFQAETMGLGSKKVEKTHFIGVAKVPCRQNPSQIESQSGRRGKCVIVRTVADFTVYFGDIPFAFTYNFSPDASNLLKSLYGNKYTDYFFISEGLLDRLYKINFPTRSTGKQKVFLEASSVARQSNDSPWEVIPYDSPDARRFKIKPSLFELEFDSYQDAMKFFYHAGE